MSSLLYGPGSETLAVVVLNSEELGRIGPTAALSVLLTVLVVVPGLLLWRVGGRAQTHRSGCPRGAACRLSPRSRSRTWRWTTTGRRPCAR